MAQIDVTRTGAVLSLTINRPEKKNSLTNAMYSALCDGMAEAGEDEGIRCVLITGAGDTFTAGNDISDFAAVAAGTLEQAERHVHSFLHVMAAFEKPVVAAVPGLAVGIGTTVLLHCDLVFLADSAVLFTPFVDLALVPEAASSLLLQGRIGYARAFSMLAMGERVDAPTALAWGLVNAVVPAGDLQAKAMAAAEALAARPRGAVVATKRLMRDHAAIAAAMSAEGKVFEDRLKSPEASEAFAAFAERRKPDYSRF